MKELQDARKNIIRNMNATICEYTSRAKQTVSQVIWDNYNKYSHPIIAFWGASRHRIWTKIEGNESQDLPGPPYSPQNLRFRAENLKNNHQNILQKIWKKKKQSLGKQEL